jgi:dienelactone hydrolase
MTKLITIAALLSCLIKHVPAQNIILPDTITVKSDEFQLKGLLWRPAGNGSFPTIIFCHGTYETKDKRFDAVQQTSVLGPLFAKNGYLFFGLFRRDVGLSKGQGENSADLMAKALEEKGQEERNKVQLQLMQTADLTDMNSAFAFLRQRKDVDTNRIAIVGHSFGGSLALLTAEHNPRLNVVITFGGAGYSWNVSPQLRETLFKAVKHINAPLLIVHAQNDYSINPGYALDSIMNLLNKPHLLKIYPSFGTSLTEGHNIISLSPNTWEADVIAFLRKNL